MQNCLIPFEFEEKVVRAFKDEGGNPWFVAKDVCRVLDITDYHQAVRGLDDDEKGMYAVHTPGGKQEMTTVSESGLYSLVFRSRKPAAKRFRKWVTAEVLPVIRKRGAYSLEDSGYMHGELYLEVMTLPPRLRSHALNYAVQTARLTGAASEREVDRIFARYCALLGAKSALEGPQVDSAGSLINRFINERLRPMSGSRLWSQEIWQAFSKWWAEGKFGVMPSSTRFFKVLRTVYSSAKASRSFYRDIALRS